MIETGITAAAKVLFLESVVNDTCKLALYDGNAALGVDTPVYTTEHEVVGEGYTAGGVQLTNASVGVDDNGAAFLTWDSTEWPRSTITAAGYMIYDVSKDNAALFVGSWGSNYTSTNGPFKVNIPDKQILLV
jgi:hypothetical protein